MTQGSFFANLSQRSKDKNSILCVGFDPSPSIMHQSFLTPEKVLEFAKVAVDEISLMAACFKPNIAFFEQFGVEGVRAFYEVCAYASKNNLPVIADVKRGDIGSTSQAYAESYLNKSNPHRFPVDAITISPFLGVDTVEPFYEMATQNSLGLFLLLRTSNPGSSSMQGKITFEGSPTRQVANWITEKNNPDVIGAVVGATTREEALALRELLPDTPFLIPGYGAQGGSAQDATASFRECRSFPGVVNATRSIFKGVKEHTDLTQIRKIIRDNITLSNNDLNASIAN